MIKSDERDVCVSSTSSSSIVMCRIIIFAFDRTTHKIAELRVQFCLVSVCALSASIFDLSFPTK